MTNNLIPNIPHPDEFYNELLRSHQGLSEAETHAFNARLILTLANQIGDPIILSTLIQAAK